MSLDELRGRRVAIWGVGQEGLALARLLLDREIVPLFLDDQAPGARARLDATIGPGHQVVEPGQVDWSGVDVVVRAPGVSRYRPELVRATDAGVSVTTAMALWLSDFAGAPVVAVTGTKGKSTTAALTASLLRYDGLEVALIGNIGVPVRRDLRSTAGRCLRGRGLLLPGGRRVGHPGGVRPDQPGPRPSRPGTASEETYYRDKLRLIEAGPPGALAVNAASDEAVRRTAGPRRPHPVRTGGPGPGGHRRVDVRR